MGLAHKRGKSKQINPARCLSGSILFPGDKSISHRYAMLAAIAEGTSKIHGFSSSADCASTVSCLRRLGVAIKRKDDAVTVHGAGIAGLREPTHSLNAGNSGSTIRMLSGLLAGQPFRVTIVGDASLSRRPMGRIIKPLTQMGARIRSVEGGLPPLEIEGGNLKPIRYELPVPSAQVKTSILFAGLFADGVTEVVQPVRTRDHTEIALEQMGAEVRRKEHSIEVRGKSRLKSQEFFVPGDFSSAVFFLVAGLLVPGSQLLLQGIGLNPTRTPVLDLLVSMGGQIKVLNVVTTNGEPRGDLQVESSRLHGTDIPPESIPGLIDELPTLAVLGTQTERGLSFRGAGELRVKESDRIRAVADNLRRMGADVEEFPDGLHVPGRQKLQGGEIDSYGDHRIAMAFAVAGLLARGTTLIHNSSCVNISFPEFFDTLAAISEYRNRSSGSSS